MYKKFSRSLQRRKWAITMRPVSIESNLLLFLLYDNLVKPLKSVTKIYKGVFRTLSDIYDGFFFV